MPVSTNVTLHNKIVKKSYTTIIRKQPTDYNKPFKINKDM